MSLQWRRPSEKSLVSDRHRWGKSRSPVRRPRSPGAGSRPGDSAMELSIEGVGRSRMSSTRLETVPGRSAYRPRPRRRKRNCVDKGTGSTGPPDEGSSGEVCMELCAEGFGPGVAASSIDEFLEEVHQLRLMNEGLLRQYDQRYREQRAEGAIGVLRRRGLDGPSYSESTVPGSASLDASPRTWTSDVTAAVGTPRTPRLVSEGRSPRVASSQSVSDWTPRDAGSMRVVKISRRREPTGHQEEARHAKAISVLPSSAPEEWGPELSYLRQWVVREYGCVDEAVMSLNGHAHDAERGLLFFEFWRWLELRQRRGGARRPWPFDRELTEAMFDGSDFSSCSVGGDMPPKVHGRQCEYGGAKEALEDPKEGRDLSKGTLIGIGGVTLLCGSAFWYLRKRRQAFWRNASMFVSRSDMTRDEIERACRMMALPQLSKRPLHKKSFLVVGCGGLANTCATYIAACLLPGCRITLIDDDKVEASNLQRQHQLHSVKDVGHKKAESARVACRRVAMKGVAVESAPGMLTKTNVRDLVGKHDVILDCTDCPATRWLLSSACATARRPLVSGAAMQWSGQVTVYCSGEDGPCMRCVFPEPPPTEAGCRGGCDVMGVFPPLPGMIGCVMASEALKLALMDGPQLEEASLSGKLLLVDMLDGGLSTRTVALKRRPDCPVCGWTEEAAAQDRSDASSLREDADAVQAPTVNSIGPKQLRHLMLESPSAACLVIDVRPKPQFDMVHLRGSVNVPYEDSQAFIDTVKSLLEERRPNTTVVCCRKGNDSRLAVCALQKSFKYLLNLDGGIMQAAKELGVEGKQLFVP
ncbi:Urmylation protein [Perkinsus chesapeaki]|uniref:Urmylation protein n=1 Tax=Perkinsus chesapeaki TaxID=330153 RepID=A0A7J6LTV2_PERCH|nr:Urmylation protein [Perkinsus chesapeaki]